MTAHTILRYGSALASVLLFLPACTWRSGGYPYTNHENQREQRYLGTLSSNPYDPESISNPYGRFGSTYSPTSINNPYGSYGSPYSARSGTNPYTTGGPRLYSRDGTYLGKLNSNPFDADSIANPYGRYGSRYSPESVNNPYGRFGSRYSNESPRNPYATKPLIIVGDK